MVALYGREIFEDHRRCESLLRDVCGGFRREVNLLMNALRERVPLDLLDFNTDVPPKVQVERIVQRLEENMGMTRLAAGWAVEAWALALGLEVVQQYHLSSPPPPTIMVRSSVAKVHLPEPYVPTNRPYLMEQPGVRPPPVQVLPVNLPPQREKPQGLLNEPPVIPSNSNSEEAPIAADGPAIEPEPIPGEPPTAPPQSTAGHEYKIISMKMKLTPAVTIDIVHIPPGDFWLGGRDDHLLTLPQEKPAARLHLPAYWISRFPITIRQYLGYVQATRAQLPPDVILNKSPNHPVTYLRWQDAIQFCNWATTCLNDLVKNDPEFGAYQGWLIRLPTEAEWEKAACGLDQRMYPWGNQPPEPSRCNLNHPGGGTTAVGQHSPRGDSPYGCADMAGNTWSWTSSAFRPYPYDPADGREKPEPGAPIVIRGGSFRVDARTARCSARSSADPNQAYDDIGFRIVLAPPSAVSLTELLV